MNYKKIFIVGVGRSGTSLLHALLGSHPSILGIKENQILKWIIKTQSHVDLENKNYREQFKNQLKDHTNWDRLNIDDLILNKLLENSTNGFEFYNHIINHLSDSKKIICDKDPNLLDYVDQVNDFIDKKRIIHIYRNPLAVVNSRIKVEWSRSKSIILQSLIYNSQLYNFVRTNVYLKKEVLSISYEDLVNNTEDTCKTMCNFIGIPFDFNMLNHTKTSKSLITSSEVWKKNTMKPVRNLNVKYEKELSKKSIKIIEYFTPVAFSEFGYKRQRSENIDLIFQSFVSFFQFIPAIIYKRLK